MPVKWRGWLRGAGGAAMLGMVGCSVDGVGFARSDVFAADGATVTRTQTYGAALRTDSDIFGLAIGYTDTLVVTPDAAPNANHLAVRRRIVGLDLSANRTRVGAMLGLSEDMFIAPIPAGADMVRRLVFVPDQPEQTLLRQCRDAVPC